MSEYQYYEFRAVDRPLSKQDMSALRRVSSSAEITPTSLVNTYHWGDFRGNPERLVSRYFDGFLYLANWGSRELLLRVPRREVDVPLAKRYLCHEWASVNVSGSYVVFRFRSDIESWDEPQDEVEAGPGWLGRLLPLRDELAAGDLRALYLGWLAGLAEGDVDDDAMEPPSPPGLSKRTAAQAALCEFLRVDAELLAAASRGAQAHGPRGDRSILDPYIARLSKPQMAAWLRRLATENSALARLELLRKARRAVPKKVEEPVLRSVGELRRAAQGARGAVGRSTRSRK